MTTQVELALIGLGRRVREIKSPLLREACSIVINNGRFQQGFGSRPNSGHAHHGYAGGLVVHTHEVLEIALSMASSRSVEVDTDVLATAAVWHDFLKTRDHDLVGQKTEYYDRIRHVAGSYAAWIAAASMCGIGRATEDEVGHCILAHHGRLAWGSPVEPQTVEAQILHFADMTSAAYGAGKYEF